MNLNQHQFNGRCIAILGTGWLGQHIARQALGMGMEVSTLTRNPETSAVLKGMGVQHAITAQIQDNTWHRQLNREQDYVVNCVSAGGRGLEGYRQSYLEGNRSILEWAGPEHPARFAYTSSTSVYPQTDGRSVDESSPTGNASEAGKILLEAESLVLEHTSFAQATVLRLAGLYGPDRHYLLNLLRDGATEFPGRGDLLLNLLRLEDAASAVFAALQDSAGRETYNVTDGSPVEKQTLVNWLANQLDRPPPEFNPDKQPTRSPIRRTSGSIPSRRIDTSKIRDALGWKPAFPDFRTGYKDLVRAG